jgi:hypothetical protein
VHDVQVHAANLSGIYDGALHFLRVWIIRFNGGDRLFIVSMENDNLKQYLSLEPRTIETLRLMSMFFSRCDDRCDAASLDKFLSQSNAPVSSHYRDDVLFAEAITVRFEGKRATSIEVSN